VNENEKSILNRISELDALIEPLTKERAQLKQNILESKSKFKVGDIITWRNGKHKGRVTSIGSWCLGEPIWNVVVIRKDGSDGIRRTIRSYETPALYKINQ
jgi:uncharacterized protein YijF (DUF1287 family)